MTKKTLLLFSSLMGAVSGIAIAIMLCSYDITYFFGAMMLLSLLAISPLNKLMKAIELSRIQKICLIIGLFCASSWIAIMLFRSEKCMDSKQVVSQLENLNEDSNSCT